MRSSLLLVGHEPATLNTLREAFGSEWDVMTADDAHHALSLLKKRPVTLCFLEWNLPDGSGLDLIRQIKRFDESIDVLVVTSENNLETALAAMRSGACDFVLKPVRADLLKATVVRLRERRLLMKENLLLREAMEDAGAGTAFFGRSLPAQQLVRHIEEAAGKEGPVLISGEPGTEKEAVARDIHLRSPRSRQPFVVMHCGSPGREKVEEELFGRKSEASRARTVPHPGKLEFAEEGTLFLEQADRLAPEVQARIVRLLQSGTGEAVPPVRLMASTSQVAPPGSARWNPEFTVYLSRLVVRIPPLRDRRKDIPEFIARLLKRVCAVSRVPLKGLNREAEQFLSAYTWPGNLKEMENTVEIMALSAEKETLGLEDLPLDILVKQKDRALGREEAKLPLKKARRHFERQYIRKVLEETRGNQTRAAESLGLHRNTLIWKLRELQMQKDYRMIVKRRRGPIEPFRPMNGKA